MNQTAETTQTSIVIELMGCFNNIFNNKKFLREAKKAMKLAERLDDNWKPFKQKENIKALHRCARSSRAIRVFKGISNEEGWNVNELSDWIAKKEKNKKNIRTSVEGWINRYKELGMIKQSEFSSKNEIIYEPNPELKELNDVFLAHCSKTLQEQANESVE